MNNEEILNTIISDFNNLLNINQFQINSYFIQGLF